MFLNIFYNIYRARAPGFFISWEFKIQVEAGKNVAAALSLSRRERLYALRLLRRVPRVKRTCALRSQIMI